MAILQRLTLSVHPLVEKKTPSPVQAGEEVIVVKAALPTDWNVTNVKRMISRLFMKEKQVEIDIVLG